MNTISHNQHGEIVTEAARQLKTRLLELPV
ncbi:MAG TPA: hypothetical protein [Caudoviricetes sp.]|nr:MAG TPA: hypothetical protein [Caudoviricetes sp.]